MKFPSWIGDPSFSQMVNLTLSGCEKCKSLPPLGQLPMLKDLCIRGMHKVEFYRDSVFSSFPLLETLIFEDMPEWEEWSFPSALGLVDDAAAAGGQFPRLRKLTIRECPKLMRVSLLRLPNLRELDLEDCNEVVLKSVADLTSLTELRIKKIKELTYLHEEFLVALEVVEFSNCDRLVNLWVTGERDQPRNLEVLSIERCVNLEKLPNGLNKLTALRDLNISGSPKLVSFPETGVPPMLRNLHINDCKALESLPNNGISHLQELVIQICSSLRSLGAGKLPTTLKTLLISYCMRLESASTQRILDESSTSLVSLFIYNWPNSVPSLINFPSLVELRISNCDGLESFPERGLPAPNLRALSIRNCPILKSLPDQIQSLTSLQELNIFDCPSLDSFPKAKGDLPPNLTHLYIYKCQKLKPLSEWGMHRLTSLQSFTIEDVYPELVSFPPEYNDDCVLPPTLTQLSIGGLENLESLSSKGLQNLTSLQELHISYCPKLRSLPMDYGLLRKLSRLVISGCPLLKQSCLKDKRECWSQIADIPCGEIDDSFIFE